MDDSKFVEITREDWDHAVAHVHGSGSMLSSWGDEVCKELPFVSYKYFRYIERFLGRVALINGRYTTTPFSDGSDVISLDGAQLDLNKLATDVREQFGASARLRINERFASVAGEGEVECTANEFVVSLDEPILPRVRKTLRHILSHPTDGVMEVTNSSADVSAAYSLYLRHMRNVRNFALPKRLFFSLVRSEEAELWVWRKGRRVHAFALFITSGGEALYSLSAADSVALSEHAPHHLVYAALQKYQDRGIPRASLGATGVGSALEVFKRGWRGKEYRIFEIGSRRFGVEKKSRVRNLVGLVPLSLYPLLTKHVGKYLL